MSKIIFPKTTKEEVDNYLNEVERYYRDTYKEQYVNLKDLRRDANKKWDTYGNIGLAGFVFFALGLIVAISVLFMVCNKYVMWVAGIFLILALATAIIYTIKGSRWHKKYQEYNKQMDKLFDTIHPQLDKLGISLNAWSYLCGIFSDNVNFLIDNCNSHWYKCFEFFDTIKNEPDVRVSIYNNDVTFATYINDTWFSSKTLGAPPDRETFDIMTRNKSNDQYDFSFFDEGYENRMKKFEKLKKGNEI